jgi:ABC-type transporter Mla maintaining outer membrane lipid asymmetry ATPase subunit MlaF
MADTPESMAGDGDLIVIDGVSHTYRTNTGPLPVLDDLTIRVPRHGFSAIVGPSGCGKSTVTRLVAGLMKPDAGTVWLQGERVVSPPVDRRDGIPESGPSGMAKHSEKRHAAAGNRADQA